MTADELTHLLNPLIYRELAAVGAIDTAMPHEDDPQYVMLFRATKLGKQASVEQMSSLIRSYGAQPVMSALALESVLKMQTATMEKLGTTPTLRAMRLVQGELVSEYEKALQKVETPVAKTCLDRCRKRAIIHWVTLTAHIAKRGHLELEETLRLPMTLDRYFAHDEARACMRCHFDRPGELGAIERGDPHPCQYVCAACHDEVYRDFAPDLLEKIEQLSQHDRQSLIIEKALGRPSTLKAEKDVLAKLSGLAPDMPPPPLSRKVAAYARLDVEGPPPQPASLQISAEAGSLDERLYIELLFDFRSVRYNW